MLLILLLAMGMFVFTFWLARQTLARDSGPKEMTCARSLPSCAARKRAGESAYACRRYYAAQKVMRRTPHFSLTAPG